jgi:hypothetical protein
MKSNLKITARVAALLLLLFFAGDLHAQLQNYEFGLCRRSKKCAPESSDWRLSQGITGITMRGYGSLVDLLVTRDGDNRFRFGEYLGGAFSTGYINEKITPGGGGDERQLKSMWISIDVRAGLQAAYAINDDLTVGANAFFEYQFGYVIMTDYHENIYSYKVIGAHARYGRFLLEYNQGLPWDMTDREDYDDHISRVQFRFFTDRDKGKNIGFRFEAAQRNWYGGRTDRLTTFEFCFGRMF